MYGNNLTLELRQTIVLCTATSSAARPASWTTTSTRRIAPSSRKCALGNP